MIKMNWLVNLTKNVQRNVNRHSSRYIATEVSGLIIFPFQSGFHTKVIIIAFASIRYIIGLKFSRHFFLSNQK